jgi:hypothetical protein
LLCVEQKGHNPIKLKYWELVADKLSKAGWSLGWVSAVDSDGRTIWIVDAHRGDGKRFVARSEEELTAFLQLESATRLAAGFFALVLVGPNPNPYTGTGSAILFFPRWSIFAIVCLRG